ncbi:MAG: ATP phosphoribosyltransferase regulatory subunit [Eubacteriales bacterium]|nr:ATP phosphoribosyltransferase regulatory subunit [Eubacteriales bacterium]
MSENSKNMTAAARQELLHTPEGVRDIYGKEYGRKIAVIAAVREQMRLFGYEDIQTPTFEFFDVFSREIGTTPSRELYKFFDKEGNTLVLRPDFTPSVARCAAKYYMDDTQPLRFCYQGSAFCNTSNLQGKLKESTQMGAELVNDGSAWADAEMIALLIESLRHTGLVNFQISIGNAGYFKGICAEAGIDRETERALREHISGKNYFAAERLLIERGIPEKEREQLLNVTEFIGSADALDQAKATAGNERSMEALRRLEAIYQILEEYGLSNYVSFDLSMLNRYDYYTGVIFKGYTYGVGDAIATGGRYDTLLSHFGKNADAIGAMIQVDSLLEALRRQNIEVATQPEAVWIEYTPETYREALQKAQSLRAQGTAVVLHRSAT